MALRYGFQEAAGVTELEADVLRWSLQWERAVVGTSNGQVAWAEKNRTERKLMAAVVAYKEQLGSRL